MKETICIIGALALWAVMAKAVDLRVIHGKTVDLQPIHDWEEGGKQGERPLKHWKEIEVVSWQLHGPLGHPVATIKVENTEAKQVWLKNCPKVVLQELARIAELEQQATLAHEQARRAAAWASEMEGRNAARGFLVVAGDPRYLNWLAAQDYAAANASAIAADQQRVADQVSSELAKCRITLAEKRILAMDTGLGYGPNPIWDTGLAARL